MTEISTHTLMLAIEAMAFEVEMTTRRINAEPPETDEEEHLSEIVLDLQRALSELSGFYEKHRLKDPLYPSFDSLVKAGRSKA